MMSKKDLQRLKENDPIAYYELMKDPTVEGMGGSDIIITLIVALIVISILVYIT